MRGRRRCFEADDWSAETLKAPVIAPKSGEIQMQIPRNESPISELITENRFGLEIRITSDQKEYRRISGSLAGEPEILLQTGRCHYRACNCRPETVLVRLRPQQPDRRLRIEAAEIGLLEFRPDCD